MPTQPETFGLGLGQLVSETGRAQLVEENAGLSTMVDHTEFMAKWRAAGQTQRIRPIAQHLSPTRDTPALTHICGRNATGPPTRPTNAKDMSETLNRACNVAETRADAKLPKKTNTAPGPTSRTLGTAAGPSETSKAHRRSVAISRTIEEAVRLLADGGYANMTLAEVGESAGYSRGVARHYFSSKEGLLMAVVQRSLQHYTDMAHRVREQNVGLKAVLAIVDDTFDGMLHRPEQIRAYIVISFESRTAIPQIYKLIKAHMQELEIQVASALTEAIEIGELPATANLHHMAALVIAMTRGFAFQWFLDPSVDLAASRTMVRDFVQTLSIR